MAVYQIALFAIAGYAAALFVYNAHFHPLARFPGPLWHRASYLPRHYYASTGTLLYRIQKLHQRYGPVVRITPNELSFADADAWQDIYIRKAAENRLEMAHSMNFYNPLRAATSLIASDRESHDSVRKTLSPGFSPKALNSQEYMLLKYVDLLVDKLSQAALGNFARVNIRDWIAFYTFDVTGQLVYGSDFECLQSGKYHPWIQTLLAFLQHTTTVQAFCDLGLVPMLRYVVSYLGSGAGALREHRNFARIEMQRRIDSGTGRLNFIDRLISAGLHAQNIVANGGFLVLAGSETIATSLTGTIYLLAKHRRVMGKLQDEIHKTFHAEAQITMASVAKLEYLDAVIKESLRFYPPVAAAAPREVPPGGSIIAREIVPAGAIVGIWHYVMYRNEAYFTDAEAFEPERFIRRGQESSKYVNDRLDSFYPFLLGPRNCLGQAIAYAELRLVLARLVWRFNIELCDDSRDWLHNQPNFIVWKKPELYVYLKERDSGQ